MPYARPARLVYSQLPRGINPAANRATLNSYRFRIAIALTVTVAYTAFLYRSGVCSRVNDREFLSTILSFFEGGLLLHKTWNIAWILCVPLSHHCNRYSFISV
jgi:hypothetical protein